MGGIVINSHIALTLQCKSHLNICCVVDISVHVDCNII